MGASEINRLRIYFPYSTHATLTDCAACEIKASGFSLGYVLGFGLGFGLTRSKAKVNNSNNSDYSYDSGPMIDFSFTMGNDYTFTLGYGFGTSPSTDIKISDNEYTKNVKYKAKRSSNTFLGLGFNFESIELLFIIRALNSSFEKSYTYLGTPSKSEVNPSWSTFDIGLGFTF